MRHYTPAIANIWLWLSIQTAVLENLHLSYLLLLWALCLHGQGSGAEGDDVASHHRAESIQDPSEAACLHG